jgi:hypothetical protein
MKDVIRDESSPNYVVRAIEAQLVNVRTALKYRRDEKPQRPDRIAELEGEEAQLASFLNFRTGQ